MPYLPPKKYFAQILSSKAKQQMIEDRCFGLEQFLKKVYKLPYLAESEELLIFARHQGSSEVSKVLEGLSAQIINM